jgi:hypothetical protein
MQVRERLPKSRKTIYLVLTFPPLCGILEPVLTHLTVGFHSF